MSGSEANAALLTGLGRELKMIDRVQHKKARLSEHYESRNTRVDSGESGGEGGEGDGGGGRGGGGDGGGGRGGGRDGGDGGGDCGWWR